MDEHEAENGRSEEEFAEDSALNSNSEEASAADSGGESGDAHVGKSGDALAWLEGPAFGSPIEEMPTLQWPDVESAAEEPGADDEQPSSADERVAQGEEDGDGDDKELADAMQWLEALAREQGTPLEEMPTLISGGDREESDAAVEVPELGATTQPPQLDSDPMAWLEQLAIDQNSPLEELPSVADRLLASEIASQTAFNYEEPPEPLNSQPLELEAALRFLEEEAAAQGVSLDDVSFDESEVVASLDEDLAAVDRMAAAAAGDELLADASDEDLEEEETERANSLYLPSADEEDDLAWSDELEADETAPTGSSEAEAEPAEEAEATAEEENGSFLAKAGAAATAAKIVGEMVQDEEEEPAPSEELAAVEADQTDGSVADETARSEPPQTAAETASASAGLAEAHDEAVDEGERVSLTGAGVAAEQETPAAVEDDSIAAPDEVVDEALMDESSKAAEMDAGPGGEHAVEMTAREGVAAEPQPQAVEEDRDGSLLKKAVAAAAVKKAAGMMAGDDEPPASEGSGSDEEDAPETGEPGEGPSEAAAAEADILDSMPDDPDEAMAWMGALAEDEASDEESAGDTDEAPQTGDEQVLDENALEGMPDDPDEAMRWMAALAAKEAATRLRQEEPEAGEAAAEVLAAAEQTQESPETPAAETPDDQENEKGAGGGLQEADQALAAGDVTAAAARYRALLDSGEERGELIAALKTAVQAKPDEPALKELLGDAYMQEGQVQQALRIYREV